MWRRLQLRIIRVCFLVFGNIIHQYWLILYPFGCNQAVTILMGGVAVYEVGMSG